ncbi:glycerate kinase type-2 family protein [Candidatus Viridilinea mediisalina]|uniref:Glycerate kinase n=1 Tax=Candidatus Viridilinea mediisalina TaxID=2024553 RepID=A0A2A6RPV4_9CHLR|nr:glycerate kinase [Candidatus Viridilinea mediisalina]PDW04963.1 glycerate kinase [Candidatus Viridilinea mediisalina]
MHHPHSLRTEPAGTTIAQIMTAALAAVDPAQAVRRMVRREGALLYAGEHCFDLTSIERVFVVGAGKAGVPMALALAELLGERLTTGLVVVKDGHGETTSHEKLRFLAAGHPLPDERGVAAAQAMATLLAEAGPRDLVIALISGGGSALLSLPVPAVSLADLQALTQALLGCGAAIGAINTLRKHLDQIKGGGLARMAAPAHLLTLLLSDVVGNPLDVIASGPTVADPTTFQDALALLEYYGLTRQLPPALVDYLRQGVAGAVAETLKPGDAALARVHNLLVGANRQAAEAACAAAHAAGWQSLILTTALEGEAREAGRMLASILREVATYDQPLARPCCLVIGGETTVTLRGNGRGGRNQELALAAVQSLAGLERIALVTLATDGGDGPTDAAGAVVTGTTLARAQALGLDPAAHLANNDAYPFFAALDDLLRPGPTGTNVNDLTFLCAW